MDALLAGIAVKKAAVNGAFAAAKKIAFAAQPVKVQIDGFQRPGIVLAKISDASRAQGSANCGFCSNSRKNRA